MITLNESLTEIDNIWFKHPEKVEMQALVCKIFDQQTQFEQHIKSLEAQLTNTEQLTCEYKEDHDIYMGTVYNFNCGYSYVTIEGDLKENGVNYCPSCGGKITSKDTQ